MVGGLLAALFALALLSWTAVVEDVPPDAAGSGRPDGAAVTSPDDKPAQEPSGGSGVLGASGGLDQAERPSGHAALVANPLYGTDRLSPLPCPVDEPDVDDAVAMEGFLHAVADCLDEAWTTQFARAGIPFEPPDRVFWSEPGVSPCRPYPSAAGAFYCRASTSIYIGTSDVVEKWNGATRSVVYASLLAHEYSHHVQGESGLLEYYHEQRELEPDPEGRNAWTRRSELQANCLAGAFLGSIRVTYPLDDGDLESLLEDAAATADREDGPESERTHGSVDNGVWWTRTGWEEQAPGACNTWDVDDEDLVE
ncbi:neutral zinc metallopeptidase [Nocardiopsis sp. NRRL B-16309]|uniref:neutral zinc metallopeptidase n=1 Tax=Nocardiopsis sp. NRRL B-16309 TaxID=1519494 RepID=UPI0009EACFC7|nr:neutral zinc metallopeptidase [Nocardiopsis sp. NRRL B-16309]